ncbi:MAG: UDP-N-acetylmuramoyl-L-alanine--D-glutamate ligase [Gammaproteobacteria bacterium]
MADNLHIIVGLGATGLSCAHYLKAQGIPMVMMDTREAPSNLKEFQDQYPDVPVSLGGFDKELLSKAACIVLSPGIALREPAIAEQVVNGKQVIGDVELFARAVKAPVISITGTNAKSTVTTLVGEMAKAAGFNVEVGGNLGVPALDLLMQNPNANLFILELSSFQLETTHSLHSAVATVLNITPDHMDRYDTVEDYTKAKHRVYQHCDLAVCNRDDAATDTNAKRKINFTLAKPQADEFGLITIDKAVWLAHGEQALINIRELPVMGKHYQANALAALAIGYGFGFPLAPMLEVLRSFKGLPHRCQFVREWNGVRWYNDSKGTNVGATQAAIEGLGSEIDGKLVLIAGGVGKNADFHPLVPSLQKYTSHVVLIGEAAQDIAAAIDGKVPTMFAKTLDEAVTQCAELARPDDCVLLSPACASFDMFKHYAHRGDVFMEIVLGR